MLQPFVSVITPSYNSNRFILETIQSVKQQDCPHVEHIIIDGGSIDGTLETLRSYPDLIWISEPDNGQSHAFNKGLKIARGDIIGWLNADDTYASQSISTAVKFFMENPSIDAIYGDMQIIDSNGNLLWLKKSKIFDLETLFLENYFNQPTIFLRRVVFDRLGGLNESLHYSMDREMWLRVGSLHQMHYIPGWVGANFRLHTDTKTYKYQPRFHAEWLSVMERAVSNPLYKKIPLAIKQRAIEQAQVRLSLALMSQWIKERNLGKFCHELFNLTTQHSTYILKYPFRKFT